jgi:hypothetical protein
MPLVIVNPTKRPAKPARKARKKGAPVMATKRHRSAAQKRAFANMIARNPRRKRRTTRNPSSRRRVAVSRHRVIHRRRPPMFGRRRRRNPASSNGMFGQLVSAQALLMIAGIAVTPTIVTLAQTTLLPSATGYYAAGFQGLVGVALGWGIYQIDRPVGQMVALVGIANALATFIANYQANGSSTLSGNPAVRRSGQLGAYRNPRGQLTMMGYVPASGNNGGNLNGYGLMAGQSRAAMTNREPGVYYM